METPRYWRGDIDHLPVRSFLEALVDAAEPEIELGNFVRPGDLLSHYGEFRVILAAELDWIDNARWRSASSDQVRLTLHFLKDPFQVLGESFVRTGSESFTCDVRQSYSLTLPLLKELLKGVTILRPTYTNTLE